MLKGARDYNRAMKGGPNRPEVIKILTETTAVKDPAQWEQIQWSGVNPDLYLDQKSLADQVDWYFDHKLLTTKPALEQVIDNSYVDYAVKQLGRFSP